MHVATTHVLYAELAVYLNFILQNAALCILFGLALLAGAVANVVYSNDNADFYDNTFICSSNNTYRYDYYNLEICDDFETLYASEGAAAVSNCIYNYMQKITIASVSHQLFVRISDPIFHCQTVINTFIECMDTTPI